MMPIVNARLQQTDCQIQGFVLEGFPKTANQIKYLFDLKLNPNLLVVLESSPENMYERLSYRKIDPLTGEIYNFNQSSPKNPSLPKDIFDRLQTMPLDKMELLQNRFF